MLITSRDFLHFLKNYFEFCLIFLIFVTCKQYFVVDTLASYVAGMCSSLWIVGEKGYFCLDQILCLL